MAASSHGEGEGVLTAEQEEMGSVETQRREQLVAMLHTSLYKEHLLCLR